MTPLLAAGAGLFTVIGVLRHYGQSTKRHRYYSSLCTPPKVHQGHCVFNGQNLNWTNATLHRILLKRNAYYAGLEEELQKRFMARVRSFMRRKTFVIMDDEAFREMPVLVSAAAVQLTFGLRHYHLPFYKYITLHPDAYSAPHTFYPLAGNVQGNTITIAWNHFLGGYSNSGDGVNVGLHEMSHALYCQKTFVEEGYAHAFCRRYKVMTSACEGVLQEPSSFFNFKDTPLEEAVALSIERFFEQPVLFREVHPRYYEAISMLLQQDPATPAQPVRRSHPFYRLFS